MPSLAVPLPSRAEESGDGKPRVEFRLDQLEEYLLATEDFTPRLETDSYYYLLWWLDQEDGPRQGIETHADPDLARTLYPSPGRESGEEADEVRGQRRREARGLAVTVEGRLVTIAEEDLPEDRVPANHPRRKVWRGMLFTADYQLVGFTTLERGDAKPDEPVRVAGVFYKIWTYENRRGGTSNALYVLGYEVAPIPSGAPRSADGKEE